MFNGNVGNEITGDNVQYYNQILILLWMTIEGRGNRLYGRLRNEEIYGLYGWSNIEGCNKRGM
jgi:hypothetical protein